MVCAYELRWFSPNDGYFTIRCAAIDDLRLLKHTKHSYFVYEKIFEIETNDNAKLVLVQYTGSAMARAHIGYIIFIYSRMKFLFPNTPTLDLIFFHDKEGTNRS